MRMVVVIVVVLALGQCIEQGTAACLTYIVRNANF